MTTTDTVTQEPIGDVIKIADGCIASLDRVLINWEGENYYRQGVVAEVPFTAELGSFDPPLLEACKARVKETVTLHIPGGMALVGRLERVNDDQTVTMSDNGAVYDVAIGSIAVVEGKR